MKMTCLVRMRIQIGRHENWSELAVCWGPLDDMVIWYVIYNMHRLQMCVVSCNLLVLNNVSFALPHLKCLSVYHACAGPCMQVQSVQPTRHVCAPVRR